MSTTSNTNTEQINKLVSHYELDDPYTYLFKIGESSNDQDSIKISEFQYWNKFINLPDSISKCYLYNSCNSNILLDYVENYKIINYNDEPELLSISIESNHENSDIATSGNIVTLTMIANEFIQQPVVTWENSKC